MRSTTSSTASLCITSVCALLAACSGPAAERGAAAPVPPAAPALCQGALPSPSLAPPAGNALAFGLRASGVQIYSCSAKDAGFAWTFTAPEAALVETGGAKAGTHYAGPTWEAADGSKVVGARAAGATPDPASIPWLLLSAASHAGAGRMAEVTFVQRLDTSGGNAPPTGCDAAAAGTTARVPYTATYCFFARR